MKLKPRQKQCIIGLIVFFSGAFSAAAAADLKYSISWLGNSFSGKQQWVLQDVEDIFVDADGTLFTNVFWDEAGGNVQQYRDGKLVRIAFHTHGWGFEGGGAVAANSKYVFICQKGENEGGQLKGNSWPAAGFYWSGVSRRLRADMAKGAPFPDGHGKEGDVLPGSFLPVLEIPQEKNSKERGIRGLWATETQLFVSCSFDDSVKVFDTESMRLLKTWKAGRPNKICAGKSDRLWVLQEPANGENWKALCFTLDGELMPQRIEFERSVLPTDICTDPHNRLLVADAGADQQIKIYDNLDTRPELKDTFGVKGGITAGPVAGEFGGLRFNSPKGVGADSQGNIYVASSGSSALETGGGGSTVLECYAPDGKLKWRVFGLEFIDLADLDPASDVDAYTKEEHFTLDFNRDAGQAGQEWSYRGYTVNKFKYPDDPRLHIWSANTWLRRISGEKFLFVSDMTGEFLQVYRFNPASDGEIAIPCALFGKKHVDLKNYPPHQPAKGEWIWRDKNGNGAIDADEYQSNNGADTDGIYVPDAEGSIWQASHNGTQIRCLPIQKLEAGVPVWDYSKARTWPKPAELDQVRRVHYLPGQDSIILGGNQADDHNQHWKPMGPVLCRYDNWSQTPKLRWRMVLPYEKGSKGHESAEPISFDVAGDYIFVAYCRGLKSDKIKNAFVKIYKLDDMSLAGNLSCDAELGEIGLLDLVESVRAVRRANGEYVVFLEDDMKSKVVMFRWQAQP